MTEKQTTRLAQLHDLQVTSVKKVLQKGAEEGRLRWIRASTPADAVGIVLTEDVDFDSIHFGIPISRFRICYSSETLENSTMEELIRNVLDYLKSTSRLCVYSRVDLDNIAALRALEDSGFREMDVLQTLAIDLESPPSTDVRKNKSIRVRPFQESEIAIISKIAHETYTPSRLFRDPRLQRDKVREYYAKWAENCCRGLADKVLVAERDGDLIGFITLRVVSNPDSSLYPDGGVIDLVRVHPSAQHQGIGTELTRAAIGWFRSEEMRIASIGTEANNLAALNCYLSQGFRVRNTKATFHRWL